MYWKQLRSYRFPPIFTTRPSREDMPIYTVCGIWRCCWCIILAKFRRYISAIFAHNSRYAAVLHEMFGNTSCYFVSDWSTQILCPVPYDAQPSDYIKQCEKIRPLRNRPDKSFYDVTFTRRFLRGKQMGTPDNCHPGQMPPKTTQKTATYRLSYRTTATPGVYCGGNTFPLFFHVFVCSAIKVNASLKTDSKMILWSAVEDGSFVGAFPHLFF